MLILEYGDSDRGRHRRHSRLPNNNAKATNRKLPKRHMLNNSFMVTFVYFSLNAGPQRI